MAKCAIASVTNFIGEQSGSWNINGTEFTSRAGSKIERNSADGDKFVSKLRKSILALKNVFAAR